MSFGISNNVRSRAVRTCTPELFWKAVRSDYVARVCAGIADAWEQWKRGELSREEYEEVKNREKLRLPAFTFHATFTGGRRLNAEAVPSGLCLYDIDHLEAPREYFAHVVEERVRELGIVLAHVTPSKEGLRFVFVIPAGMSLAEAQEWMSRQLNDPNYDRSVKDLARSSFAVPEEYFLYIDEEGLFNEKLTMKNEKREVTGEAARNEVTHFSSSGEEEYPKGEVVAAKTLGIVVFKIMDKGICCCRYHPGRWPPLLPGGGEFGYFPRQPKFEYFPRQPKYRYLPVQSTDFQRHPIQRNYQTMVYPLRWRTGAGRAQHEAA